jgi:hypothetical protein
LSTNGLRREEYIVQLPQLNNEQVKSLLNNRSELNGSRACNEAQEWFNSLSSDTTLQMAYEQCQRADWMLWLFGKMADKTGWLTRKQVVLLACDCAETALKYVPNDENRPRLAIEAARKWVRGEATLQEVKDAAAHAAIYAAAYAAAHATYAAAHAVYAADAAAHAATYAAYAADAAAHAADAHMSRIKVLAELTDLIRVKIASWNIG